MEFVFSLILYQYFVLIAKTSCPDKRIGSPHFGRQKKKIEGGTRKKGLVARWGVVSAVQRGAVRREGPTGAGALIFPVLTQFKFWVGRPVSAMSSAMA